MKLFALIALFLSIWFAVDLIPTSTDALHSQNIPQTYIELSGTTDSNLIPYLLRADTMVITQGNGGLVYGMFETINFLKSHPKKRVIIDGPCFSACTLLLNAPQNVRITQNTRMFFHSAVHDECVDGLIQKRIAPQANTDMWKSFETLTRKWITESKAFTRTSFTEMPVDFLQQRYAQILIHVPQTKDTSSLILVDADGNAIAEKPKSCPFLILPLFDYE